METFTIIDTYEIQSFEETISILESIEEDAGASEAYAFIAHRSSHYGAIANHGAKGFRYIGPKSFVDFVLSVNADRFTVEENENGEISVTFYDHDGTTYCDVVTGTEDEFVDVMRAADVDIVVERLEKMPRMKIE